MVILAILGIVFIFLIISFLTTNNGNSWEEKMESLDKKIQSQKTIQKAISDISILSLDIMDKISDYYAWVDEQESEHNFSQTVIEENEQKQTKVLAPLFVLKFNFLEELKKAFYSHSYSAQRITNSASQWNSMWRKSYDENVLLQDDRIQYHLMSHKEEIMSLVTIKTHEIKMLLEHQFTTEANHVTTEQITRLINLLNKTNKNQ